MTTVHHTLREAANNNFCNKAWVVLEGIFWSQIFGNKIFGEKKGFQILTWVALHETCIFQNSNDWRDIISYHIDHLRGGLLHYTIRESITQEWMAAIWLFFLFICATKSSSGSSGKGYGNYQQAFYAVDCSFQEMQIAWIDVDYEFVHGVGLFQHQVKFSLSKFEIR